MDTPDSNAKFDLFLDQIQNRQSEELLKNLPQECRPQSLLEFHDFVPMSAKFSPKSVENVIVKLREFLDRIHEDNSLLEAKYDQVLKLVDENFAGTNKLLI